ncbi:MAG: hypothetical protein ACRDJC_24310 [Thermomicrobiales bacterium]
MDDCRFDNWTRTLVEKADRRTAVKGLAGGAAALLTLARAELGLAQSGDVTIEDNCKGNNAKCRKDKECCSKKCKKKGRKGRDGKCECAGAGQGCKRDQGCCSGKCQGTQCVCGDKGDRCRNDRDCCSNVCRDGNCRCVRQGDRCNRNNECCSNSCSSSGFCN